MTAPLNHLQPIDDLYQFALKSRNHAPYGYRRGKSFQIDYEKDGNRFTIGIWQGAENHIMATSIYLPNKTVDWLGISCILRYFMSLNGESGDMALLKYAVNEGQITLNTWFPSDPENSNFNLTNYVSLRHRFIRQFNAYNDNLEKLKGVCEGREGSPDANS